MEDSLYWDIYTDRKFDFLAELRESSHIYDMRQIELFGEAFCMSSKVDDNVYQIEPFGIIHSPSEFVPMDIDESPLINSLLERNTIAYSYGSNDSICEVNSLISQSSLEGLVKPISQDSKIALYPTSNEDIEKEKPIPLFERNTSNLKCDEQFEPIQDSFEIAPLSELNVSSDHYSVEVKNDEGSNTFDCRIINIQTNSLYIYCHLINGHLNGLYREYYQDGSVNIECTYKDSQKCGQYKKYDSESKMSVDRKGDEGLLILCNYENDKKHGEYTYYWGNGNVMVQRNYIMDVIDGKAIEYWEDGKIKKECMYKNGRKYGLAKRYDKNSKLVQLKKYWDGKKIYEKKDPSLLLR